MTDVQEPNGICSQRFNSEIRPFYYLYCDKKTHLETSNFNLKSPALHFLSKFLQLSMMWDGVKFLMEETIRLRC